jgi:TolB-like protein
LLLAEAPVHRADLTAFPPRLSIVVLPFANLSNDPDQEYLTDAITDDLTTDLSRISGIMQMRHQREFGGRWGVAQIK